jgi:hypothetical protein
VFELAISWLLASAQHPLRQAMTQRLEDFDFEETCRELGASASVAPAQAQAAHEIAGYALHYLFATDQLAEFRDYLRTVRAPVESTIKSEHVFENMEQAERWLQSQPPPEWGEFVKVAGRTCSVEKRAVTRLVLMPSFTPEELLKLRSSS